MLIQMALGSGIIGVTALAAALAWWALEIALTRTHPWVARPPHGPKLVAVLTLAMFWTIVMMTASVWIWALSFWGLGIFESFEASVYFALVAFTTLGFGDILLPLEWRLLAGLAAANGLLIFGIFTAMLVETIRETRSRQREHQS